MDVDNSVREGIDEHGRYNTHPASHDNPFHLILPQHFNNGSVQIFTVLVVSVIEQYSRNTPMLRSCCCLDTRIIVNQDLNLGVELPVFYRLSHCLKVTAIPRSH